MSEGRKIELQIPSGVRVVTLTLSFCDEEAPEPMPNDKIRVLVEKLKQQKVQDLEERERRAKMPKLLSRRANKFWAEVHLAMGRVVEEFKAEMAAPDDWKNLLIGATEQNGLTIQKHESPYLNALFELDIEGECIHGSYRRAPRRPTSKPISGVEVVINLKVDPENKVYGSTDAEELRTAEDVATYLLAAALTPEP